MSLMRLVACGKKDIYFTGNPILNANLSEEDRNEQITERERIRNMRLGPYEPVPLIDQIIYSVWGLAMILFSR